MRPLDGLVTTRTGSRCSRVGPAVTTTLFPCHGARCNRSRSAAARIASGSLMRPGRSLGPSASGPVSGPTNCQPRPASIFRLVRVAGWAYIASFIAGAASTGPVRASNKAVSTSSASPIAARASTFAVAGATSTRSRPTRRGRRAGRRTPSAFLAPPPHQLVRQPAAHQLVQRPRGELLLEVHRAIARELVHETGELGGHQHAQVLVLGLRSDFARGHNPHHLLLPVDCFSWLPRASAVARSPTAS